MKRSRNIYLLLLGSASTGAFTGCSPGVDSRPSRVTSESYFTNDYHIPGVGYYHAPFHRFFPYPYNYYNPSTRLYYAGGMWLNAPNVSVINISAPSEDAARYAEAVRTDIQRGGFGSSGGYYGGYYGG